MTVGPADDRPCWGCGDEATIAGSLGSRCRQQLADRRTESGTPRLNDMIAKLGDVHHRLCWQCETELATSLAGLCPLCDRDLRGY